MGKTKLIQVFIQVRNGGKQTLTLTKTKTLSEIKAGFALNCTRILVNGEKRLPTYKPRDGDFLELWGAFQ